MKQFFKNIFTQGYSVTDYVPVGLHHVNEKAELHLENEVIDVSTSQYTLAYNPLVIGLVIPEKFVDKVRERSSELKLVYVDSYGRKVSELRLAFYKKPAEWNSSIYFTLFHASSSANFQLNWFTRNIILVRRFISNRKNARYFGTLPYSLHEQYAAQFSFPRKVVLLAVQHEDFYKLFPIDLHGHLPGSHMYVLGIRHSNSSVAHLKKCMQIVIADVPHSMFKEIYNLGNFSAEVQQNHVEYILTECFKFKIPKWVLSYKEVALQSFEDIGSQCFFFGHIKHAEDLQSGDALHHIHFLQFLHQNSRKKLSA